MNCPGRASISDSTLALACGAASLLARLGYGMMGLRFDLRPLDWFMQYLDPVLLRTRLSESLWYLHSQPPGFNLFLGLVLKTFPGREAAAFAAAYALAAAALCWAVFLLQRRLGVGRQVAVALTLVLAASPGLALYSNWLFYSLPVAALLALAGLALARFGETGRARDALAFFVSVAAVCLVHGLFHLVFLLAAVVAVLAASRGRRKVVLATAALPVLLVTGVYTKNLVVFGRFTASTWTGMNLWGTTGAFVPEPVRERLVSEGRLSWAALVDRFESVELYPAEWRGEPAADVPALTAPRRASGFPNFNHQDYIDIGEHYLRDALASVRYYPVGFVKGLAKAWFCYFKSPSDYVLLEPNMDRLAGPNRVFDLLLAGRLPWDFGRLGVVPVRSDRGHHLGFLLLVGLPLVFLYGVSAARRGTDHSAGQRLALCYIVVTVAWVALVGNTLEAGENQRFRFATDPLSIVLLGLFAQRCLAPRLRPRRQD
ncbi:MAG: hypothetical protein R6X13_09400 [bacterium]